DELRRPPLSFAEERSGAPFPRKAGELVHGANQQSRWTFVEVVIHNPDWELLVEWAGNGGTEEAELGERRLDSVQVRVVLPSLGYQFRSAPRATITLE